MLLLAPVEAPPAAPSLPRWSLEVGGLYQRYARFETPWGRGRQSVFSVLPVHLRLGVRLNDGNTLYLGLQYRHRRTPTTLLTTYPELPRYYYWQTTREVTTVAVPFAVGLPIASTRLAPTAWRVEFRAGVTLLAARYRLREYSTTTNRPEPYEQHAETPESSADVTFTAGGRVGYGLGKHLELTADGGASFSPLILLTVAFGAETSPFGGGGSLGLTYRF
ncbi:hypothetical protein [Hymenobacter edaphi]|uniref:hypothetical protein n=1 Tax=Hymenobacter edaphi TaxID=2211146 RepID=UPI001057FCA1|nr:hypothetical protein [Hymenobacter edaphi]